MPAIKLKKVTAEYLAEKEKAAEKSKKNLEDVAAEEKEKEKEEEEDEKEEKEEVKPFNFLEVQVLFDKRKRTIPAVEQKLVDWLDANLEQKEDVHIPLPTLYEYYSEVCQMQGDQVADIPVFNKYMRDKFGKFFGFKDNSPYKGLVKERKVQAKKPKVQGETLQLKIRDIITEVINDAGNPHKGLQFRIISKGIIQKYPAQRVDIYPKKLRSALERGVYYGWIESVRGVGMCGYYRVPGEPTKEEEEEKGKKKEKKGETEETEEGTEQKENGEAESGKEKTDEGDSEEAEDGEENKGEKRKAEEDGPGEPEKKKKKRTKKKKKESEKWLKQAARHSDPQRVEDTFPMAITYQSDPKEASINKIAKYIEKFYHTELSFDKLKRALTTGGNKGLWEQLRGNTYHLLCNEFNPGYSEDISDQIAQALVATSEPKIASGILIKKYITNYHPKLNVESRTYLLSNALERACQKGTVRQLSGVGMTGSFQLLQPFVPSPAILAGDSSDEEEDEVDSSDAEVNEYVPRPTKRGRLAPKQKSKEQPKPAPKRPAPKPKKAPAIIKPSGKASKGKKKYASESESEAEEVVEYTPRKASRASSDARGKGKPEVKSKPKTASKQRSTSKKGKSSTKKTKVESDESESDEEKVPYTPPAKTVKKAAEKPKSTPKKKQSAPKQASSIEEVKTPPKSKSRSADRNSSARSGRATAKKTSYTEVSDGEENSDEEFSKGKKSGGGGDSARKGRRKSSKISYQEVSDQSEDEDKDPKAVKRRGGISLGRSGSKKNVEVSDGSSDEEESNKGRGHSAEKSKKDTKQKYADSDEDMEVEVEKKSVPKSNKKKKGSRR